MIVKKTWIKTKASSVCTIRRYHYTGWFLLGLLPLYVARVTLA